MWWRPSGSYSKPWSREHVGDAVELLLLAERAARAPRSRGRTVAVMSPSTLRKSARGLSSLFTKTSRGMPSWAHFAQHSLGADLDAVDGADDEHGEVGDRQRGVDVAGEVGVARRVDQVDLVASAAVVAAPLERSERQRQRHRPLGLLRLGVAHGRPVLDPSRPGRPRRPARAGPRRAWSSRCRRAR